jgi:hypothetical protein
LEPEPEPKERDYNFKKSTNEKANSQAVNSNKNSITKG